MADSLVPTVYHELRGLASAYLRSERSDHTLQATALVHEIYLRLSSQRRWAAEDRQQFLSLAAHVMRQVLVDYARSRRRHKRGGKKLTRVALDESVASITAADAERWLTLDAALDRLALLSPRQARIVELRYFGGLTVDETAGLLDVSAKTVKRDWAVARAWLRGELGETPTSRPSGCSGARESHRFRQIRSRFRRHSSRNGCA